jgi:hypothetical protein
MTQNLWGENPHARFSQSRGLGEGQGRHRKIGSEGSSIQTCGATNRNQIRGTARPLPIPIRCYVVRIESMSSIFLCHSSEDKPFVRRLASKLTSKGIKVWLDEAEINRGDSLSEKIGSAINEMSYFAIILSNNSIDSQWVKKELQVAIQKELAAKGIVILPLMLHKVDIPPFLRDRKYGAFTDIDRFDESFEQLLTVLKPVTTTRFIDNITSFDIRRAVRKKSYTRCQLDGYDIVIVDISQVNLGFLSNIPFVYNEVRTINIQHDYFSEIIKFVVTRSTLAGTTGFKYFIGADILERDVDI